MIAIEAVPDDKLIFAAAGTTLGATNNILPVVFPANLSSNLTVAVTGVKDIPGADNETESCSDCHSGSAVDFAVVMEKGTNTGPITLPMTPNPTYPDRP